MKNPLRRLAVTALLAVCPALAMAADLDGARLSALWGVPFAGILLSIALLPLLTPAFWHRHYGKLAAGWAVLALAPIALGYGAGDVRAVTYEYGNAFLVVAGLLNLLVVIDAYDIALGRK